MSVILTAPPVRPAGLLSSDCTACKQQREQQRRRTATGVRVSRRADSPAQTEGPDGFGRLPAWPSLSPNPSVEWTEPARDIRGMISLNEPAPSANDAGSSDGGP